MQSPELNNTLFSFGLIALYTREKVLYQMQQSS